MFWKRNRKKEPPQPVEDRIGAIANKLHQEGRTAEMEAALAHFDPDTLGGKEKESWYHVHGIVAFQRGDRDLAFERFQEGLRYCPDSGLLRFALGQEFEFRAEVHSMFRCFDEATFPEVPAQYALAQARYAYLWNRTDKGWSYIDPLVPVYLDLKVLDDTFLYIRALPSFTEVWGCLAAFSQIEGDFERIEALTERVASECSDSDFDYFRAELKACNEGDFIDLKEKLQFSIRECERHNLPGGYQSMRFNIIRAQETENEVEAARILDDVRLTDTDFPWLEDMRLLAKCQQAHRARRNDLEAKLRRQFLARQPMLFEPYHAFYFQLLQYQQTLTEDYQRTRKNDG